MERKQPQLYDVWILDFDMEMDPVYGLMRIFGLDEATAASVIQSVPCTVKSGVSPKAAQQLATILRGLGARTGCRMHGWKLQEKAESAPKPTLPITPTAEDLSWDSRAGTEQHLRSLGREMVEEFIPSAPAGMALPSHRPAQRGSTGGRNTFMAASLLSTVLGLFWMVHTSGESIAPRSLGAFGLSFFSGANEVQHTQKWQLEDGSILTANLRPSAKAGDHLMAIEVQIRKRTTRESFGRLFAQAVGGEGSPETETVAAEDDTQAIAFRITESEHAAGSWWAMARDPAEERVATYRSVANLPTGKRFVQFRLQRDGQSSSLRLTDWLVDATAPMASQ